MPTEELEKFRIIETKKAYRPTIRDWLVGNFKAATWDQCRIFVFSFYPPGPYLQDILRNFRIWEAQKKQPWQVDDANAGLLQDELLVMAAQYRADLDHLSWVGSMVPPLDETETIAWATLSSSYLLSPFTWKGVSGGFLTIHGKPRSGKTGTGCDMGEIWLNEFHGTEVLTNIPLEHPVDGVRVVADPFALFHGVADALKAKRRWLWAWDEPTLSGYGRGDAATSVARNLDRFARIVPKLGGSLIYIEHREEGVPTVLSDFSQSHITCTNPGMIIADLPGQRISIRNVPMPRRMKYRTGEAGYFELQDGFDWQGVFRALRFNPELMMIEDMDASTQGERIERFLTDLEAKPAIGFKVSCRKCGATWTGRSDRPGRCPKCDVRDPTRWGEAQPPSPAQSMPP